ncbi:MAG: hypothetical protein QM681_02565 [Novosphingobium sp.]
MPETYLRRVTRNLIRDEARSAYRRSTPFHVHCEDLPLAGPDPVAQLEARDTLARHLDKVGISTNVPESRGADLGGGSTASIVGP